MAARKKAKSAGVRSVKQAPSKRTIKSTNTVTRKKTNRKKAGGFDWTSVGKGLFNIAKTLGTVISGFGDYKVNSNSLMDGGMNPPQIVNSVDNGGVIVRHREYVGDIVASQAFTLNAFNINPGIPTLFPWLSTVAQNFEEYSIRGMIFEFKSTSADNVLSTTTTSTALGTVIMATEYNVLNPPFQDKRVMENYEFANSSKPSLTFVHPVECKSSLTPLNRLFIRSGAPYVGDLRIYDLGLFQIATSGMAFNGGSIGELWVSYEIELYKPKLFGAIGFGVLTDNYGSLIPGFTSGAVFSGSGSPEFGSNLGTKISPDGLTLTFPTYVVDGAFLIDIYVTGAAQNNTLPSLTYTKCSPLSIQAAGFGVNTGTIILIIVIEILGAGAIITSSGATVFPSNITGAELAITQTNLLAWT